MKVLFAAPENAWGGFFGLIGKELPQHEFVASGRFGFDSLRGFDVLIPTMSAVRKEHLEEADRLQLIQQCGAGLEAVDIQAAQSLNIRVANVPSDISGNADSVAELGIYLMIGLSRNFRQMALSLANRQTGTPPGRGQDGRILAEGSVLDLQASRPIVTAASIRWRRRAAARGPSPARAPAARGLGARHACSGQVDGACGSARGLSG